MISERGVGTYRQEHPKTDRSNRVIALPSSTAEALRRRLAIMVDHSLDALVVRSREGPRWHGLMSDGSSLRSSATRASRGQPGTCSAAPLPP